MVKKSKLIFDALKDKKQEQARNFQQMNEIARMRQEMAKLYSNLSSQIRPQIPIPASLQAIQQFPGLVSSISAARPLPPQFTGYQPTMQHSHSEEQIDLPSKGMNIKDITLKEAKKILLSILSTGIVPYLWGPPGVGKSELLKQICKEKGWDLIDLRLSLLNPVDLRGLPVVNRKKKLAEWYPPAFLPNGGNKNKGILFLDELNLAPLAMQAAAYQLILDKQVGEYKFPSHWMIVAAGNREIDKAQVYKLPAPLANRFIHINIIPDFYTWKEWAVKNDIHTEIINFLTIKPNLLLRMPSDSEKAFASPRSWMFLSNVLNAFNYKAGELLVESLKQTIVGTIGDAIGKEFIAFLERLDAKKIASKIENFIKTGRINLPRKHISIRHAIIIAILNSYLADKITKSRYDSFIKKLSKEEREVIKKTHERYDQRPFEQKYGDINEILEDDYGY